MNRIWTMLAVLAVLAPILVGLNLVAQRMMPTTEADSLARRTGYRLLVRALFLGGLFALIGIAVLFDR